MLGVPLKEIVEEYLLEEERDSQEYFYLYLQYAIAGLKILHREADGITKTVQLSLSATDSAPIPNDFVKMIRLFAVDKNGSVTMMSENTGIYKPSDGCGNLYTPANNGPSGTFTYDYFSEHFRYGQNIGGYYNIDGRSVAGEYRINRETNRIEFVGILNNYQIILEYIAEPQQINGQFYVHPYLREAIKDYIDYKSKVRKRGISRGEKLALRDQWVDSMIQAKMDLWGDSMEEIINATRKNISQTPNI